MISRLIIIIVFLVFSVVFIVCISKKIVRKKIKSTDENFSTEQNNIETKIVSRGSGDENSSIITEIGKKILSGLNSVKDSFSNNVLNPTSLILGSMGGDETPPDPLLGEFTTLSINNKKEETDLLYKSKPNKTSTEGLEEKTTPLLAMVVGKFRLTERNYIRIVKNIITKILEENGEGGLGAETPPIMISCTRALFENITDPMVKMLIGQYIINHTDSNEELENVYNYIKRIANDDLLPTVIRMNALDILRLSNNTELLKFSEKILNKIRQRDNKSLIGSVEQRIEKSIEKGGVIAPRPPTAKKSKPPPKSLYSDTQNVHDSKINSSVLDTASEIIKKYSPSGYINFDYNLIKSFNKENSSKIEKSIHRIQTDESTFKHGTTLFKLFQAILNLINNSEYKVELYKRLTEELIEMSSLCVTGHLSRLVNVIQGFNTDVESKISTGIDEEIYSKIKNIIEREINISNNSEILIDDFASEEKSILIKFIGELMRKEIPTILTEYKKTGNDRKDILKSIQQGLNKYIGLDNIF